MTTVIGFAGFSNSGKTTLISKLVTYFAQSGLRTAVIKHDAHGHYKEAAGTDSSIYREAGAAASVVVSPDTYIAFRRETTTLEQIVEMFLVEGYDLILIEGFKNGSHDKIALFREPSQADIVRFLPDPPVAVAAPKSLENLVPADIPFFDLDHIDAIAGWIENRMKK